MSAFVAKLCISFLEVNVLLPPYMSFFCYHVFRNFPKFLNIKPCNPANYNPLKAGLLIASGKSIIFQEVVISFEIFRETWRGNAVLNFLDSCHALIISINEMLKMIKFARKKAISFLLFTIQG